MGRASNLVCSFPGISTSPEARYAAGSSRNATTRRRSARCGGLGLEYLHVPWAPFWAILAAGLQFIPHFGPVLAFFGPAVVALFDGGFEPFLYVLVLYGIIIVIDGLVLQPVIMRRAARVPIWASLIVPILLSLMFGFWGLLLAAPLLAVIFAYRTYMKSRERPTVPQQTPPGQPITGGRLISPEPATGSTPPDGMA